MPTWLYYTLALSGLVVLLLGELRSSSFRRACTGEGFPARAQRNWSFFAAALMVAVLLKQIEVFLRGNISPLLEWSDWVLPNVVGCFLVAELSGWLLHFVKHKSAYLWRFHFQHHQETDYNIWLVTHTHGLEVLISGTLSGALLIALGFSSLSVQVYFLFYSLANTYQHSCHNYSLGWLDKLIVGPAYHRYHHAVGSQVNFGNTLTIWDLVFKTARFPKDERLPTVPIGIEAGDEPYGFVEEMAYFLKPEESEPLTEEFELPVRALPRGASTF